jgi:hypothetical protein
MATTGLLSAALAYAEHGFSVIPLSGKKCEIKWTRYQTERAPFGLIHRWQEQGYLLNIGIVCGSVSGNLAVIDLDGLDAVIEFDKTFAHLPPTYRVNTGSYQGQHVYFFVDKLPPTTRTKGFELRADGCYVVAPPSIHPVTGALYRRDGHNPKDIARLPDLDEVQTWIAAKIKSKHAAIAAEAPDLEIRDPSAYGQKALDEECNHVASATTNRNNQLNKSAYKLGYLVWAGHLHERHVIDALLAAATQLSSTDGEQATLATIYSGLFAGMEHARTKGRVR